MIGWSPTPEQDQVGAHEPRDLSLGAGGVLPSRHIESFLRVFKQFTHNLPSRQVVGYLSMCPPLWSQLAQWVSCEFIQNLPTTLISICPVGKLWIWSEKTHHFAHEPLCERTPRFLSQFWLHFVHHVPKPLTMSSFIIYSQCTQPHTHWVLFNVFKRNSQFVSIFQQTLKELIEHRAE